MRDYNFFVYITTNPKKTVLYTGVTNNLFRRMTEHHEDCFGIRKTFAGKFFCYNLVYHEWHKYVNDAIAREKEIKGWTRKRKKNLV